MNEVEFMSQDDGRVLMITKKNVGELKEGDSLVDE